MFYDEGPDEQGGEEWTEDEEEWTQVVQDDQRPTVTLTQVSHERVIVHIDIDCFYAQVEMINDPDLMDKPLGIQQKNILVTCNYIARQHGLTKLMFLKDAQQKCPDLVIRNGEDLTKYRDMSTRIFNVLLQYSPLVEKLGLDENFVDVTAMVDVPPWKDMAEKPVDGHVYGAQQACSCGCVQRLTIGSHICAELRRALHTELGVTSCGGVSHNKLLAKVAGEQNKPNAQTVLFTGQERKLMESLGSVRKVPGIGHVMSKTLGSLGVLSVADLAERSVEELSRSLGHHTAERLHQLAHGMDGTAVTPTGKPQSISDEDSFKKCSSIPDFKSRTTTLVDSLLSRLLTDGRHPATLRLSVRKFDPNKKFFGRESRQRPLHTALFHNLNTENLRRVSVHVVDLCLELFHKMIDSTKPFHLTLINVCFTKFSDTPERNRGIGAFLRAKEETAVEIEQKELSEEELGNKTEKQDVAKGSPKTVAKVKSCATVAAFFSSSQNVAKNDHISGEDNKNTALHKDKESGDPESTPPKKPRTMSSFFSPKICDSAETSANKSSVIRTPESLWKDSNKEPCSSRKSDSHDANMVPSESQNGIDMDTFQELPPDIQEEILKSKAMEKSHCLNKGTKDKRGLDNDLSGTSSGDFKLHESSNSLRSSTPNQCTDSAKLTPTKLPPGIDPAVFSQLPPDVQKSVLTEHHAQNVQKEFRQMKNLKSPPNKKAKKSGGNQPQANISSFFKKK